jgi:hypothetical protein
MAKKPLGSENHNANGESKDLILHYSVMGSLPSGHNGCLFLEKSKQVSAFAPNFLFFQGYISFIDITIF